MKRTGYRRRIIDGRAALLALVGLVFLGSPDMARAQGNPDPRITTINPSSGFAGGPGFTLSVFGFNFVGGSVVRWNGANRATTVVKNKDNDGALREYSAAAALVPDNLEMVYWHAVALVNMGRVDQSLPLFRRVFRADKNWLTLTPRLAKVGLLPSDQRVLDRILKSVE